VNSIPLQLALREMRATYASPRSLVVMAVIAAALGLAGPFGTFDQLAPGPRVAYWAAVVFATYAVGGFAGLVVRRWLGERIKARWLAVLTMGLSASIPVTLVVMGIDLLFLGSNGWTVAQVGMLWVYCFVIGTGTSIILVLAKTPALASATEQAEAKPAPLLRRLPVQARGRLSHMSMQDHYVEIVTDRGRALILMRLSDAMGETGDVPGIQIHRSHWVALAAVKQVSRRQGKVMVDLTDGTSLPISRGYMQAAKVAGLVV
jgi:DNA-binding LytR/AlgR family response regulator